ncbi:hypothetical protein PSENEW3_00003063 [Picochlorum sp. SENEW3]|nr:hypothetical protein PSENEW3_00003063 [Picochlorum sp. SENEW3]
MASTSRGTTEGDNGHLYTICFTVENGKHYGSKAGQSKDKIDKRLRDHTNTAKNFGFNLCKAAAFHLSYDNSANLINYFEKFLCWLGRIGSTREYDVVTGDSFFLRELKKLDETNHASVHKYAANNSWEGTDTRTKDKWRKEACVCKEPTLKNSEYVTEEGCVERLRVVQSLYHAKMMFTQEGFRSETRIGEAIMSFCKAIDASKSPDEVLNAWTHVRCDAARDILEEFIKNTDSYVSVTMMDQESKTQKYGDQEPPKKRHRAAQKRINDAKDIIDQNVGKIRQEVETLSDKVRSVKEQNQDLIAKKKGELLKQLNDLKKKLRLQE